MLFRIARPMARSARRLTKFRQRIPADLREAARGQSFTFVLPSDPGVNRPGIVGGSNFQIGWSHHEQDNEQVFTRGA